MELLPTPAAQPPFAVRYVDNGISCQCHSGRRLRQLPPTYGRPRAECARLSASSSPVCPPCSGWGGILGLSGPASRESARCQARIPAQCQHLEDGSPSTPHSNAMLLSCNVD